MTSLLIGALVFASSALAADDIVIANFEGRDYGDWVATGDAFGQGPSRGVLCVRPVHKPCNVVLARDT